MRCTQATLEALGINGECPKYGTGVLEVLQSKYKLYQIGGYLIGKPFTLKRFVKEHTTGKYYIFTEGHAMALVDGILVDTTERGADKRHVLMAWEVNE